MKRYVHYLVTLVGLTSVFTFGLAQTRDQVIVGLSQEPTVFNPLMPSIEVDKSVHIHVFDSLWGIGPAGDFFPKLVSEVPSVANGGISEDGLTWTVNLRDDVVWHDGEPFDAEDVQFTLELILDEDFRAESRLGHELIESIEVIDPTTITWQMSESYAPYLAILASTYVVPEHVLAAAEDPNTAPFNLAPIGTGPYMWEERIAGDSITLVANPDYWGEGPYIPNFVYRYIPDLTVMYTQFRTGEIDFTGIQGITADNYNDALTIEDAVISVIPASAIEAIWFNLGLEQFQDPAVRQAMYIGMDKQTIIDIIYYGLPTQAETFLPSQSWAYDDTLPLHSYDPEQANAILDEAGWLPGADGIREKDGVRLSFINSTTAGNQVREQAQVYLQQNWRDIGVEMVIENFPAAVIWADYWVMSQFETVMVGLLYGQGPDPDATNWLHEDFIPAQGGSGGNSMQYANSTVSELFEVAATTADIVERQALYAQIQQQVRQDLPFLPIFQYARVIGMREGLTGFVANPNLRMYTWNVHEWRWEE